MSDLEPLDVVLSFEDRRVIRARLAWQLAALGPQLALRAVGPDDDVTAATKLCIDLVALAGLLDHIGTSQHGDFGGDTPLDEVFVAVLASLSESAIRAEMLLPEERAFWISIFDRTHGVESNDDPEGT